MSTRRSVAVALVATACFLSSNGPAFAARWRSIGPFGGVITQLVIDPDNPEVLYAGTDSGGVFKTVNGGATWSRASKGLPGQWITALAVDPVTTTTLYAGMGNVGVAKTTDGGASWKLVNSGLTSFGPRTLAVDPGNPSIVYLGTFQAGVFKSTNGATSWSALAGTAGQTVEDLAVDPASSSTVYATTENGVLKSSNGGASWTPMNNGLTSPAVGALLLDPSAPAVLYVTSGFHGVFKSINAAGSWAPMNNGFSHLQIFDLALDPNHSADLYAATFHGIFRSQNAAGSWTPATAGLPAFGAFGPLVIDPGTPTSLYSGAGQGGIFKTTSSGASWSTCNQGLAALQVRGIEFDPESDPDLFVAAGGGVYRTGDEGASWSASTLTVNSVVSLALDTSTTPTTAYAGTNETGNLQRSGDAGTTWFPAGTGLAATAYDIAVVPQSGTLFTAGAGTSHPVFRSDNAAASWAPADAGLPNNFVPSLVLDPDDPNHLLAATFANGLFASTNQGASWTPSGTGITTTSLASVVAANPTTFYVGSNADGVFKSTNGGANWGPVNNGLSDHPSGRALTSDPSNPAVLYTGGFEGVFKTSNGGANWAAINGGLPDLEILELAVDPAHPNVVYAGTDGSSVWRLEQGPDPPAGPYLSTPELPDFRFKVRITGATQTSGKAESDCIGETLCISGAKAGRSELFVRVIGPRPNGFLWINLVRFTPSRVEVWAEQLSSGVVNYYDLPALPVDGDTLIGVVDKEAFDPAESAAQAAGSGGASPAREATFVPPAFPDYRFTVRIFSGPAEQPAKLESDCIPETVCVSGAKAGRSELFLRIIGPRPNGFLWVNVVRFTTSRVEVEIERISTGATKSYELAQVPQDSAELPGIVDKQAFVP